MSQDPMGFGAGDFNIYRYVFNSTPNLIDPQGTSVVHHPPGPTMTESQFDQLWILWKAMQAATREALQKLSNIEAAKRLVFMLRAQASLLLYEHAYLDYNQLNFSDSAEKFAVLQFRQGFYRIRVAQGFISQERVETQWRTLLHEQWHQFKLNVQLQYTELEEEEADNYAEYMLSYLKQTEAYRNYMEYRQGVGTEPR